MDSLVGSLMECALRDGVSYRQGDDEEHPDHGFKCEEPPVCRDVASATDDIQTSVQVAELEIIKQDSFPDIVLGHSKSNVSPVVGRVKKSQIAVSFKNYWSSLTEEGRGEKKKRRRKKKEGHAEHVQREPENSRPVEDDAPPTNHPEAPEHATQKKLGTKETSPAKGCSGRKHHGKAKKKKKRRDAKVHVPRVCVSMQLFSSCMLNQLGGAP